MKLLNLSCESRLPVLSFLLSMQFDLHISAAHC
jgi:hypothetical protein